MATNSKRHPVDRPARAKVSLRPVQEKRDDDIMNVRDTPTGEDSNSGFPAEQRVDKR